MFEPDPSWPKLPNDWVLGTVSSVAVDHHDHIWVLHRPRSVPEALRSRSAPPVLEFDASGAFVNAWGGDGSAYDWPDQEHGISIDEKGHVWIGGSGGAGNAGRGRAQASRAPESAPRVDSMLIEFTGEGKFVKQIGSRGNRGNTDTKNLHRPADAVVSRKTNELLVADGYGNKRVIVFDAETGAFKRLWGAFGSQPIDTPPASGAALFGQALDTQGQGDPQFSNPVHAIKISNDDLVYVADRANRRIQVFTSAGKFVAQGFVNRAGPSNHSAAGLAFSSDPQQQYLYVADYGNSHVAVLDRKTLDVLYQFGAYSARPGDFRGPHHLATDSKGNLYVAEVNPGNRAQKFLFKGLSSKLPPSALTPAQLAVPSAP